MGILRGGRNRVHIFPDWFTRTRTGFPALTGMRMGIVPQPFPAPLTMLGMDKQVWNKNMINTPLGHSREGWTRVGALPPSGYKSLEDKEWLWSSGGLGRGWRGDGTGITVDLEANMRIDSLNHNEDGSDVHCMPGVLSTMTTRIPQSLTWVVQSWCHLWQQRTRSLQTRSRLKDYKRWSVIELQPARARHLPK